VFGYGPKFGLIAVDRETQERTPKESAHWLGRQAQVRTAQADDVEVSRAPQPA
jgi:beta-glucosidase